MINSRRLSWVITQNMKIKLFSFYGNTPSARTRLPATPFIGKSVTCEPKSKTKWSQLPRSIRKAKNFRISCATLSSWMPVHRVSLLDSKLTATSRATHSHSRRERNTSVWRDSKYLSHFLSSSVAARVHRTAATVTNTFRIFLIATCVTRKICFERRNYQIPRFSALS